MHDVHRILCSVRSQKRCRISRGTLKFHDRLSVAQIMDGLDTQLCRIADYGDEQRDIEARLEVTVKTNAEVRRL